MARSRGYKAPGNYVPSKKRGGKLERLGPGARRGKSGSAGGDGQQGRSEDARGERAGGGRAHASGAEARGRGGARGRADNPGRGSNADRRAANAKRGTGRGEAARGVRAERNHAGNGRGAQARGGASPAGARTANIRNAKPEHKQYAETAPARLNTTKISAEAVDGVTFADLGLDPRLVEALAGLGAEQPYPIQVATIPDTLAGRNVLGRGRTGSGKTIAFGAALVQRLFLMRGSRAQQEGRAPGALILAPTRELAVQIDKTIRPMAHALGLYTAQLYGGVPHKNQLIALERGVDIVIGTPGRCEDLAQRGYLDLSHVIITVLDEADEMSAMGFIDQVERLLDRTRNTGQRLLFSATLDADVRQVVDRYLPSPVAYEIEDDMPTIDHRVYIVVRDDKDAITAHLARTPGLVLIFMRTKLGVERMVEALKEHEVRSIPLHGDLSQDKRTANLQKFATGKVQVLVATDMAARGLHVPNVRLVVQADPPDKFKTYLHRAGRTGRAGEPGTVVTLVAPSRRERMQDLLELAELGDVPMIPASPGGTELDEFGR
ncbi:DEAD/DEAH box helicase [Gulosibacter bifidus]|uniref:DEAD/DEAH box helicase n=1 Tax=Gulosibacter bifidus TaxID=272239 RepID=A0ABW5RJF6_9MICO|nr:DEAD/DEAH box helicase [Gulosibacter bifidus]